VTSLAIADAIKGISEEYEGGAISPALCVDDILGCMTSLAIADAIKGISEE
jgi:hypothetical protein